ncbi:MAG: ChbG/HpnK family deacetylase [Thermoleophilia bacterium]
MRIIVNADDFGMDDDTVDATIDCFERGALTSATLMVGMPATARAAAYAREHPEHGYGAHLVFSGSGQERSLVPAGSIPHLVDAEGRFLPGRTVRVRALLGRIPVDEIAREAEAQLAALVELGVPLDHVDAHRHLHKLPPFRAALERVLPRFGLDRVRAVQDVYLRKPLGSPTYWVGGRWDTRLRASFRSTDHFYMPTSAGDRAWEGALATIAATLPGETLEVGVHPGRAEEWRREETRSLLALAGALRSAGHELVDWRDVGPGGEARLRGAA